MFSQFFYVLRNKGVNVSLTEWLTLMEALQQGLYEPSLTNFYYLSRMILVKSETEFDKFDMAFEEYFKGVYSDDSIRSNLLEWLDKPEMAELSNVMDRQFLDKEEEPVDAKQVEEKLKERLKEQDSEHNGGNYWIGTIGKTSFGNTGGNIGGIRIGGYSGNQSAFQVIGERRYRDFRNDRVIDNRQFQMALRKLRQFSTRLDVERTELDIDRTIDTTCNNGGYLKLEFEKPRKNAIKLLLLMDSGGTMFPYSSLLNELFQAVNKSNHFKDVKTYFFHNCIYSKLYKTPECDHGDWVDTEWVIRNLDRDYKVIIVGDAAMAPEELYSKTGNFRGPNDGLSGLEWLQMLKRHYRKIVWLNPKMAVGHAPWREAETQIKQVFPMYLLTVTGLKEAMKKLMTR